MSDIDKYEVYVSDCVHSRSLKIADLETDHEMDEMIQPNGKWCLASEVEDLIEERDKVQTDLEEMEDEFSDLKDNFEKLMSVVYDVLVDGGSGTSTRNFVLVKEDVFQELSDIYEDLE